MKTISAIVLALTIFLSACSSNSTPNPDTASIQKTALAIAGTTISQTQAVGLVATVNAQGTQLSILSQPTIAITPTPDLLNIEDNGLKLALLAVLGGSDAGFSYTQQYNDGNLAIGNYFRLRDIGFWIAQKNSDESWGIVYMSHEAPLCKDLQKLNLKDTMMVQCLDSSGNQIILNQWQGQ
jgi:hypothetical protein